MRYVLLGIWIVLLVFLYIAGSPAIKRASDEMGEGD